MVPQAAKMESVGKEMKELEPFRVVKRLTGFAYYLIGKDVILQKVEQNLIIRQEVDADEVRPIFIIGPPRTGSTLLYELMISGYRTSYFSNLASLFFKSPASVTEMSQRLGLKYRFSGSSTFGYIRGLWAPSEAGPIFNYWFGRPLENRRRSIDPRIPRHTIKEIMACMGGPFVSKNLNNSLRLEQLSAIFPKAVFVHIRRSPIYTAQSIILSRRRFLGSDGEWFSVKPPNYKELLYLPPFEQVAWQIKAIEDHIDNARSGLMIKNIIETHYGNLTADWRGELSNIAQQCRRYGVPLVGKGSANVMLKKRDEKILSDAEWQRLTDILREVYESHPC